MRKIKLRCWDNVSKKWVKPDIEFIPYQCSDNYKSMYLEVAWDNNGLNTTIEFSQYTGLHDKNGKEIYEGDIIDTYNPEERGYPTPTGRGSVAQVIYHIGKIDFSDGDCDTDYCGFVSTWDYLAITSKCEVIGNIYENPELLK